MQTPPLSDPPQSEQLPLGSSPSYDDVVDVGSQYSFPCSDPPAIGEACKAAAGRIGDHRRRGPGSTPGHGEPVVL
jgi:hypothetical protein